MKTWLKVLVPTFGVISAASIITPLVTNNVNNFKPKKVNNWIETKKSHHTFLLMVDSFTSIKAVDVFKKEGLFDELNGWDIKMNVLSSGGGTDTGLGGIIGGFQHSFFNSQIRNDHDHITDIGNSYDHLFESASKKANIKHSYLSFAELYDGTHNGVETVKGSKNVYLYSDSQYNEPVNSLKKLVSQVEANEDNFSFFLTDTAHGNAYENYKKATNSIAQFINLLKERKMYDNSTIIITSDHGRPIQNPKEFTGENVSKLKNIKFERRQQTKEGTFVDLPEGNFNNFHGPNQPIHFISSLLYKREKQDDLPAKIDYENLYSNMDAATLTYNSLGINTEYLKWNWNTYMNGYNGYKINSFIEKPIETPSKNRIMLSFGYDFQKKNEGHETINVMDKPIIGPNAGKMKEIVLQKYYLESLRNTNKGISHIGEFLKDVLNA